ncbi:MAG: hypothetical protein KBD24_00695 [Candidatus Pacebacteria bacterium]|nr:hypothetical protein [Candidatus Paceibacterota bacterium]
MFRWKKQTHVSSEISPEEILLDAHNLPDYDAGRLEGRINRPIGTRALVPPIILLVATALVVIGRAGQLMALEYGHYEQLSENNRLGHSRILAERGIIYDRTGVELVWNAPYIEAGVVEQYHERVYATSTGSGHVLGYVRMPARDTKGVLYREGVEGVAGVELAYDKMLRGVDGTKIIETDARMDVVSEGLLEAPVSGRPLHLTVDARLQEALNKSIAELADRTPFTGGAGMLFDIQTGEILALTSYPEYEPSALVQGDAKKIASYATDPRTPYLNRAMAGQYTPGSIVKPYIAIGALNEGIVKPETSFVSTGSLRLANPYNPGQYTVFNDWRAHGVVDLKRAIAVSSDVYFYYVGGGFGAQEGLGITRIDEYMRLFGFGMPTGISLEGERFGTLPTPAWKAKMFPDDPDWRIGNTYHTAIGQYGMQVTLVQVVRAVAALANGGLLLTPRIETDYTQYGARAVDIPKEYLKIVREGMRDGVLDGTAKGLDVPYVTVAAKTGTAEIGLGKDFVHSWVTGFYPYDKPRYAFVILMEHGPRENLYGATFAMRQFLDWMHTNAPEYLSE